MLGQPGNPRDSHFTYYVPRPYAEEFKTPYQHPEIRFARDTRYKLYADGRLFDLAADPTEKQPLEGFRAVRRKLEAVLKSMPAHGQRIPEEHWRRARGVPVPAW